MQTPRPGRLVLASENPQDVAFATACAEAAQRTLVRMGTLEEALEVIDGDDTCTLFCEASSPSQLARLAAPAKDGSRHSRVHLIVTPERLSEDGHRFDCRSFGHLLLRRFPDPRDNGGTYGSVLRALANQERLDLEGFLPQGTSIRAIELRDVAEKQDHLALASRELLDQGIPDRIAGLITGAWDELLINALFDAPLETGKQDPSGAVVGDDARPVGLRYGFAGPWIAASVTDRYGSLMNWRVLYHLTRYYSGVIDKSRDSEVKGGGGAGLGLGLALILRSGGSLHFLSIPGERTCVTLLYRSIPSLSAFKSQFQFASIQVLPGADGMRGP